MKLLYVHVHVLALVAGKDMLLLSGKWSSNLYMTKLIVIYTVIYTVVYMNTSIFHSLYSGVQEDRGRSVGVKVYDIKPVCEGLTMFVHQHTAVRYMEMYMYS